MTVSQQHQTLHALKEIWGFTSFRPFQEASIRAIFERRDSLSVLPTGGGKSLCYQLPAGLMPGVAIIVSPLISLMADQVQSLQVLGIPAAYLNSSQNGEEIRSTKAQLFQGKLKLLYVSPERLMQSHFLDELRQVQISFFAIDEAHCISQWGHDFRPEYQQLSRLKELFPNIGIHGFTATAPPAVQNEILQALCLNSPEILVGDYHRENLKYRVLPRKNIRQQVLELVASLGRGENCIVYCLTRRETETIAKHLTEKGYRALPYHAGMDSETRTTNQEAFSQEKVSIIVATVAFGMGIDQSNVRAVIHLGMPRSLSHYQQESGRAGRDGLPAQCILIQGNKDIQFWRKIIADEGVLETTRLRQLDHMIRYATHPSCRHKTLIEYFGQTFNRTPCNACDVCNGEIESIPGARRTAKIILSAIYKTKQRFGGAYVAQVLTGSREKKVLQNQHDELSVYNLLNQHSQHQVHDWIQQLESQGYLARTMGDFPVLQITRSGYFLLRPDKFEKTEADLPVFLVETRKAAVKPRPTAPKFKAGDQKLYDALKRKRASLASKNGVPAFVIFGDRSLQDMVHKKPLDEASFLEVFGVGQAKLRQFGRHMLTIIRQFVDHSEIEV